MLKRINYYRERYLCLFCSINLPFDYCRVVFLQQKAQFGKLQVSVLLCLSADVLHYFTLSAEINVTCSCSELMPPIFFSELGIE